MKDIIQRLKTENLTDYASIPFWSWNNELNPKELVRQIRRMKDAGCGGFIMHARTGLITEYLSEEWFHCVEVCLQEAERLGMNAWLYDENGWPSGFVGGELLKNPEFLAPYLVYEVKNNFDETALAVYERTEFSTRRLIDGQKAYDGKYHSVYLRTSPANTDILNPDVVTAFLSMTYDRYYERFKSYFGKTLKGFFTDEPQYFRYATPISRAMFAYGDRLTDGLLHLFFNERQDYEYRVWYYETMNELYTHNFYERIYRWCEEHHCMLTGHSIEETALFTQMWGCAGCTPSYEFEHIPGVDNLGQNGTAVLSARQIGSAAQQLGKKHVLTETFGCSGYDVSVRKLRAIAEKQYVHGVNFMCQHLYPYSLAGQGKVDHPPCFSAHMPWTKEFRAFNDYFTRLGYLLANSRELADVAVINPMQSLFLDYYRNDEEQCMEVDRAFAELQAYLGDRHVLYHIADETILRRHGSVEGDALKVGACTYRTVVIPYMRSMAASTKKLLEAYVQNGGKVFLFRGAPEYTDGVRDDYGFLSSVRSVKKGMIESDHPVEYTHRKGDDYELLYVVNEGAADAQVTVPAGYRALDLLSLRCSRAGRTVAVPAQSSAVLIKGKAGAAAPAFGPERDILPQFRFVSADANSLILDYVSVSKDGVKYADPVYYAALGDDLIKSEYKGKLFVKYAFTVETPCKLVLLKERDRGRNRCVNGRPVTFRKNDFDVNFIEADITDLVRRGVNEFTYEIHYYQRPVVKYALFDPEATESLRNCLTYDTEIESVYLMGDFSVNENRAVAAPAAPAMTDTQNQGFPHFKGKMTFSCKIVPEAPVAKLRFAGAFAAAAIRTDGKAQPSAALSDTAVLKNLVPGKETELTVTLESGLRNFFGPLHFNGSEEGGVGPVHFTMRGTWEKGASPLFDPAYRTVPFGVNGVYLSYQQK